MNAEHGLHAQETSILALIELLNEIKVNPSTYQTIPNFDLHLKNQASLCRLAIPDRSIIPSSLNTFKRYCAKVAPGGFQAIDQLRNTIHQLIINESNKSIRNPRATQKQKITKLQGDCERLNIDLLRLTKILKISMTQTAYYAHLNKEPTTIALFSKERRELVDMLSMISSDVSYDS
ncbi:hypothetical protein J2X66_001310 [Pseudomonas sp. 3296]|jgi:hypothetical protein|nr:hypothetical protein [Pseudomonas sp. 3296]